MQKLHSSLRTKELKNMSFFDLDHTLLHVNSSFRFGVYLYKSRVFSAPTMFYLAGCYWLHSMRAISIQTLQQLVFKKLFLGCSYAVMYAYARSFLDKHLDEMLYLPAIRCLQQRQEDGHYTAILSSSPCFLVSLIAERLGVEEWGATEYALDHNQCFARISRFMLGPDKARYLIDATRRLGIPIKNVTAYSDSHLDLSFLQAAGTAVGVNPNKTLHLICQKNHWPIL